MQPAAQNPPAGASPTQRQPTVPPMGAGQAAAGAGTPPPAHAASRDALQQRGSQDDQLATAPFPLPAPVPEGAEGVGPNGADGLHREDSSWHKLQPLSLQQLCASQSGDSSTISVAPAGQQPPAGGSTSPAAAEAAGVQPALPHVPSEQHAMHLDSPTSTTGYDFEPALRSKSIVAVAEMQLLKVQNKAALTRNLQVGRGTRWLDDPTASSTFDFSPPSLGTWPPQF